MEKTGGHLRIARYAGTPWVKWEPLHADYHEDFGERRRITEYDFLYWECKDKYAGCMAFYGIWPFKGVLSALSRIQKKDELGSLFIRKMLALCLHIRSPWIMCVPAEAMLPVLDAILAHIEVPYWEAQRLLDHLHSRVHVFLLVLMRHAHVPIDPYHRFLADVRNQRGCISMDPPYGQRLAAMAEHAIDRESVCTALAGTRQPASVLSTHLSGIDIYEPRVWLWVDIFIGGASNRATAQMEDAKLGWE